MNERLQRLHDRARAHSEILATGVHHLIVRNDLSTLAVFAPTPMPPRGLPSLYCYARDHNDRRGFRALGGQDIQDIALWIEHRGSFVLHEDAADGALVQAATPAAHASDVMRWTARLEQAGRAGRSVAIVLWDGAAHMAHVQVVLGTIAGVATSFGQYGGLERLMWTVERRDTFWCLTDGHLRPTGPAGRVRADRHLHAVRLNVANAYPDHGEGGR